jgi:predicted nuclease of predicted toxin-antitoxin system
VQDGDKVFYDLRRKEDAVIITIKDEDFDRVVIGVEDPEAIVELIEKALR